MPTRFDLLCVFWTASLLVTAAPAFAAAEPATESAPPATPTTETVSQTDTGIDIPVVRVVGTAPGVGDVVPEADEAIPPARIPTSPGTSSASKLPNIGSPADRLYSIGDEIVLGQRVMHSVAAQEGLLNDPLITDYVQQLGVRLASGVFDEPPFDRIFPEFSVIDYPAINAFAAPGGHIAVFTGLIVMSEDEAELCSVIAHEIAHVRLRHYAQSQLKGKEATGTSILGIIAGVLTAIANPVAGGAVLISTMAGTVQQKLKHSRQHEYEADVFGYQYLKNAGYDPQGMIVFHRRLLRLHSQNQQIEYLQTHPVSTNRISEIASRVAEDRTNHPSFWMRAVSDHTVFHLMKARLLARENVQRYASLARQKEDEAVQKFYKAMRAANEKEYSTALSMLKKLIRQDPENAVYLYAAAEIHNAQQEYAKSSEYLDSLLSIYPKMTPALLLSANNALNVQATNRAFRYLRKIDPSSLPYANDLLRLDYLSQAYYQSGDLVEHYLAKADLEFKQGHYREAFYYMRIAVNNRYINAEKKTRVQALLDERLAFVAAGSRRGRR